MERGLGLAICKGLVEAHGGRIWAKSGGEGQGARFTFTVPLAAHADGDSESADVVRGSAGPQQPRRAQSRILAVDDDPQALRYVRDVLTTAGYAAVVTGDHGMLSGIIQAEKPHLVLLDLMLSGTDGIELMEHVPELAEQPVIFVSAYGRDETIARALGAGAADYIVKPFSPTELTARVRAALRKHAAPDRFVLGQLAIDYERRQVTLAGRPLALTATEYEVLRRAVGQRGAGVHVPRPVPQGLGAASGPPRPKLVHALVKRLRRKLGEDGTRAAYIRNERGVGYRMPEPGETASDGTGHR